MIPPLLLITDRLACALSFQETLHQVLEAGCRWIMIREKDLPADELLNLVEDIKTVASPYQATLIVNGNVEAAKIVDGIHLQKPEQVSQAREQLGLKALIGLSTHSLNDVDAAISAGASYITLSPIFRSISKPDHNVELGTYMLGKAASYPIPVVALGGITFQNSVDCFEAGAASVAVIGSIMQSKTPYKVMADLLKTTKLVR